MTDTSETRAAAEPANTGPSRRSLVTVGLGAAGAIATTALAAPPARAATSADSATGRAVGAKAGTASPAASAKAGTGRYIDFHAWQAAIPHGPGRGMFLGGTHDGTRVTAAGLEFAYATGKRKFADPFVDTDDGGVKPGPGPTVAYETASWTSAEHTVPVPATELVASLNADTPGKSWVEVQVRVTTRKVGKDSDGRPVATGPATTSGWLTMARWCQKMPARGGAIHRSTVDGQVDGDVSVLVDTALVDYGRGIVSYRMRVNLLRPVGSGGRRGRGRVVPSVRLVGAMASNVPTKGKVKVSPVGRGAGIELKVPTLSQMVHKGQYPQWGGGGESWCSPTSVAMAMLSFGAGPSKREMKWVRPQVDPIVAFSAYSTWDHMYEGAGNWTFSTAYPAEYGLEGFVTRLPSLTALEDFIAAGIPVVTAVAFDTSELDGAGYSTDGHLMLVIGFTKSGDVIANDPASHFKADNDEVRVVYKREQFENVWLPVSGGTVYIVHPRRGKGSRLPRAAWTGLG